jgi:hypothetical protein
VELRGGVTMMSKKGVASEIKDVLKELETREYGDKPEYYLIGKLRAFCEVLDGDLFRVEPYGKRLIDEDTIIRIEKYISL